MTTREFQALKVVSTYPKSPSTQIMRHLKCSAETTRNLLKKLLDGGFIFREHQRRWRITNMGQQVLKGIGTNVDLIA